MKRIFSLLLAMMLILTAFPMTASAKQGDKLIALTFDDGPHKTHTPELLDGLKARGAKATFYTLGKNVRYYPEIVQRAYEEGHEVDCHSWDHPDLQTLDDDEIYAQVEDSMLALDSVCGEDSDYTFRPPYGSTNAHVREQIPYPLIYWSIDTEDWKYRDEEYVSNFIIEHAYDGAIILCHDIHGTSIPGALKAVDALQAQGYEFVTVRELYRRKGAELVNKQVHYDCESDNPDPGPIPAPTITCNVENGVANITIEAATDAPIYYTTDGSCPKEGSSVYAGPFSTAFPCNIRAVAAYNLNGSRSEEAVMAPGVLQAEQPELTIDENLAVTITSSTVGAPIYVTTDGSDPAVNGTEYAGPLSIQKGQQIRAISGTGFFRASPEARLFCSSSGNLYRDIDPDSWFLDAMDRMAANGLMTGSVNYRMMPLTRLTRSDLAAMLYDYSGEKLKEGWKLTGGFTDLSETDPNAEAIEWAVRNQLIGGWSRTEFKPGNPVSRQELCVIIGRFLQMREHPLPQMPEGTELNAKFSDAAGVSDWAKSSVEGMVQGGLILGDGVSLNPKGNASRAEAATVLTRMMDYETNYQG